jgi:hypothetical protein
MMKMNFGHRALFTITALTLCTVPAYANHGLEAMGKGLEILFMILLGVIILTIVDFVIAIGNISKKRKDLRVWTIVLSIPFLVASLLLFTVVPLAGFIGLAIELVLWMIIYKSWPEPDAESI